MLTYGLRAFWWCTLLVAVTSACGGRVSPWKNRSGRGGSSNTAGSGGTGGVDESSGGRTTAGGGGADSEPDENDIKIRTDPKFDFPAPQGPVALDSWAEKSAESMCAFLANARGAISRGNYRGERCVSYFTNFYREVLDLEALVADGRVVYDPNSFGECLTEFARSTYRPVESIPCILTIGALSEGASCNSSLECQRTMTCRFDDKHQNGTCKKRSTLGEDCSSSICERGLYCYQETCHKQSSDGAHCDLFSPYSECLIGAICTDINIGDYTGECLRPNSSNSSGCGEGYTNHVTGQEYSDEEEDYVDSYGCRLRSLPDESCVSQFDDACTYDSYCYPKVCKLRAQLDETCEPFALNPCVYGTRCDQTLRRCVNDNRGKFGDRCNAYDDCYSRQCNNNQCERASLSDLDRILTEGTATP
jgi:hypothetical protein